MLKLLNTVFIVERKQTMLEKENNLTVEQLQEQIDHIIKKYDDGDDTIYFIYDDGVKKAILKPYDGPYESVVQQDENGDFLVELPKRLLSKCGITIGDELDVELENNVILIKKK